jgi:hypothetical protein
MIWISQPKLVVETIAALCAHCLALSNSHDSELQAAEMQLFVAATRGAPDNSFLLESGVRRIAARLFDRGERQSPGPARGGLARNCAQGV